MTIPIVERVAAAFVQRLEALEGVTVERERDQEVAEYPFLNVYEGGSNPDDESTQIVQHDLTMTVEGFVDAEMPAELGPARNALYARVVAAALADPSLGGVAIDVREGDRSQGRAESEAGRPVGWFVLDFTIRFATRQGDPYSLGP